MNNTATEMNTAGQHLTDREFHAIRELVYKRLGINLTYQKRTLLVGRLNKVIRTKGFKSFGEYYKFLENDTTGQAVIELADHISTNYTFFFRENDHFDYFSNRALPEAVARHKENDDRTLRIWSAGCSSGEESYTLTMLMLEVLGLEYGSWDAGILATDISTTALKKAAAGLYPDSQLRLVPPAFKYKYFKQKPGGQWAVAEQVKREVTYRRFNLMTSNFPFKNQFDIIFCRNVMIYFDAPTRQELVTRFYDWLVPGGYLFIGHSETIPRESSALEHVMPALYRKVAS